jgi:hypothetical protein
MVLTGIDIIGIQAYVFASNRIRDVLSASWLVEHVTSREALMRWGVAEEAVLMSAGGNAIVEFADLSAARTWTASFTRWLHDTAPGLEVVVAHRDVGTKPLAWGLQVLQIDLARMKIERIPTAPQLGVSVTARCAVTGLPASDVDQGDPVSPAVKRLRDRQRSARVRWREFTPKLTHAPEVEVEFPAELDRLGRTFGDSSLLGIVHIDGNGVGAAISAWLRRSLQVGIDDATVRAQYRAWSLALTRLGERVLRRAVDRIAAAVVTDGDRTVMRGVPDALGFALSRDDGVVSLPIRPLLLGGDDLTFVCDGRIALDVTVAALSEFTRHLIPHLGDDGGERVITACAGVALVKAHAPFHRSYELSEALCASAKAARSEANERTRRESGSWLDWHVGVTRPGESVSNIRARQYRTRLTMRPYPLQDPDVPHRDWRWFDAQVLGPDATENASLRGFRSRGDTAAPNGWAGSRSRVKGLGQLLQDGGDAVTLQMNAWRTIEPSLQLPDGVNERGLVETRSPLLDAIELLDLHLRLDPPFVPRGGE